LHSIQIPDYLKYPDGQLSKHYSINFKKIKN
jgi:hypothetical protein